MANYDFLTITAAQALAYNAQTDSLSTPAGDPLLDFLVSFDDAAGTVRITDTDNGHAVVFGSGIYGELILGASQAMQIGSPGPDLMSFATVNFAGAGNDTIGACNVAYGGPGADVFDSALGSHIGQIRDWESGDALYMSSTTPTAANYVEGTAADQTAASAFSSQQIAAGKAYVVVAVGPDLFVYADSHVAGLPATTEIMGRGLNDISESNFHGGADPTLLPPPPPPPPPPVSPPPPPVSPPPPPGSPPPPPVDTGVPASTVSLVPSLAAPGVDGIAFGNMDHVHLSSFLGTVINDATSTGLSLGGGALSLDLQGFGFTYDGNEQLTGGVVQTIFMNVPTSDGQEFQATLHLDHSLSAAPFGGWVATDATQLAFATILAGNDTLSGAPSATPDLIRGYGGNDLLYGDGGSDTIMGGDGDDIIYAYTPPNILGSGPSGSTYLRGEAGDDQITGGVGFDDANGNMGNDTIHGMAGDDFSVGGKDNDLLFGDDGNDVVWGNLGNDTCDGGNGDDQCRGGQGDDSVTGGAGNDFISGDRGNDTVAGGAGADIFHTSQDAGIDKVLDFHLAEGDRVMLDPGTTFTLRQDGADTIIDLGGGNEMILVGVQMSTLTAGWIFGA